MNKHRRDTTEHIRNKKKNNKTETNNNTPRTMTQTNNDTQDNRDVLSTSVIDRKCVVQEQIEKLGSLHNINTSNKQHTHILTKQQQQTKRN